MKWRQREKYSCIKLALALINGPGLSYRSNISRRQTKLTRRAQSCVLTDLQGHCQPNVSHKAEQKQTCHGAQRLKPLRLSLLCALNLHKAFNHLKCFSSAALSLILKCTAMRVFFFLASIGNMSKLDAMLLKKCYQKNCFNSLGETEEDSGPQLSSCFMFAKD